MVVDIRTEPALRVGEPSLLFEGRFVPAYGTGRNYDVSPDGEHFVMVQMDREALEQAQLRLVLNWAHELQASDPPGRR
jgi:hypothetical protein